MVVCLDCSGELSIYRGARVLRGRVRVDMRAAVPASYGARRWRGSVQRVQTKLLAATARLGGVGWRRIDSVSAAVACGIFSSSPAAAVQGSCLARVWRGRGGAVMLKASREGPGRACAGGVARGQ
jgi:hypothetical protein